MDQVWGIITQISLNITKNPAKTSWLSTNEPAKTLTQKIRNIVLYILFFSIHIVLINPCKKDEFILFLLLYALLLDFLPRIYYFSHYSKRGFSYEVFHEPIHLSERSFKSAKAAWSLFKLIRSSKSALWYMMKSSSPRPFSSPEWASKENSLISHLSGKSKLRECHRESVCEISFGGCEMKKWAGI